MAETSGPFVPRIRVFIVIAFRPASGSSMLLDGC
jgi:hypothetical protein